ncbi:MAG: hypothetical protein GYA21_14000 [Myxococcales bacterium]|nr:hypothetical protein [Myxococcales bacterium]
MTLEPETPAGDAGEASAEEIQALLRRLRARRLRHLVLLCVFAVFSGVLLWMLRDEIGYFFSSGEPLDLGAAEELSPRALPHNTFVSVQGIARDLCVRADLLTGKVRFLYLLGSEMGSRILIQVPAGDEGGCLGAEERAFRGRLVALAATRRFDGVVTYYREHFPSAPRDGALYLLLDGERPRSGWFYPAVVGVLLLLFAINLRLLVKMRRRIREVATGDAG